MDFVQIIGIIGDLSLVALLVNTISGYLENRKSRYTNIITKQTLDNNKLVRENYAVFATLTKPEVIDEAKSDNKYKYKYNVVHAMNSMETQLKYTFQYERDMISCARCLCKYCIKYYDEESSVEKKELDKTIRHLGKLLYEMMAPYDYSDWLYIKAQAKGRAYKKSSVDFELILKEYVEKFENSKKPEAW